MRGRSEKLRLLAVQLALLASLEDVVTNGLQSLLEAPSGLIAPVSAVERALPAALLRPRSRSRSPLPKGRPQSFSWLHSAQPAWATGLSVKSCPAAPPDCSVSSHRCSGSPPSVAGLVEPRSAASAARVPEPRAAAADPSASALGRLVEVAPLAPLRQGVANGRSSAGETDVTPNVRCGVRFSVKISPALQCGPSAPTPDLMMITQHGPHPLAPVCRRLHRARPALAPLGAG